MADPIDVELFTSWAHADEPQKSALTALLTPELHILREIAVTLWADERILTGRAFEDEIEKALDASDYGLLLISPAFLGSDFIRRVELPPFLGVDGKGFLPVLLKPVPLDGTRDLHGIDRHQIFALGPDRKAFSELDRRGKERFAQGLATAIRDRVVGDQ